MKPHEQCKAAGLKNLSALSDITGVSIQTLNNWHKYKPKLFKVLVAGAAKLLYKSYGGESIQSTIEDWIIDEGFCNGEIKLVGASKRLLQRLNDTGEKICSICQGKCSGLNYMVQYNYRYCPNCGRML